jgi:signal transduction histidine kinase/ActR/RegA family two-component response regulator
MQFSGIQDINLPVFTVDSSLVITWANEPFRTTCGLGADAVGTLLTESVPDEMLGRIVRYGMDSKEELPAVEFAWSDGGESRHFLVSISPNINDGSAVVLLNEVTEWRWRQQQVIQASRLAALEEVVAGISHEINNPLAAIMGLSQLMLRRDLPEPLRDDMAKILDQAGRAAKVVASLQISTGVPGLNQRLIDVPTLVRRALEEAEAGLDEASIAVEMDLDPEIPQIEGDFEQLAIALSCIVDNAARAMSGMGSDGRLSVTAASAGRLVSLAFTDNGPGIKRKHIDRIFDPFFTTREVGEGTGLGLSMCYRTVERHGGSMDVTSSEGNGAVFMVYLPAAEPQPAAGTDIEDDDSALGARLLVVEDEPAVAEFLVRTLSDKGYRVDVASSGSEVLDRTTFEDYGLMLLDMIMPDFDGKELYEYISNVSGGDASNVVFMTGDTGNPATAEFIRETGNPVLAKPFSLEHLLDTVHKHCVRR